MLTALVLDLPRGCMYACIALVLCRTQGPGLGSLRATLHMNSEELIPIPKPGLPTGSQQLSSGTPSPLLSQNDEEVAVPVACGATGWVLVASEGTASIVVGAAGGGAVYEDPVRTTTGGGVGSFGRRAGGAL